ncbi:MAG: 5-hydroxyisourate hydrolase, partial [uncultured Thermoleophilia bacterium]
ERPADDARPRHRRGPPGRGTRRGAPPGRRGRDARAARRGPDERGRAARRAAPRGRDAPPGGLRARVRGRRALREPPADVVGAVPRPGPGALRRRRRRGALPRAVARHAVVLRHLSRQL